MRFIFLLLLLSQLSFAKETGCPQIKPDEKDLDGTPLCPSDVYVRGAWSVYRCAVDQANSFHRPTINETQQMSDLLDAFKDIKIEAMRQAADKLNLQVCRVKHLFQNQKPGSYLLVYVKPGIKDYSGPFLMLREGVHSKVLIVGPHDDSDGTAYDTKLAVADSYAVGLISNGHRRGNVRSGHSSKQDDFVHSGGIKNNLGTYAVKKFCDLHRGYVVLHIHGMTDPTKVLVRSRNVALQKAFEKAVMAHTNIKTFMRFNADFTIDKLVNTDLYLKTEIPYRTHVNNKRALVNIVRDIEEYDWAWE